MADGDDAAERVAKRNRFENRFGDMDDVPAPAAAPTPTQKLWDAVASGQTPRQVDGGMTPTPSHKQSRWDRGATPTPVGGSRWDQPTPSLAGNKWDATPLSSTPQAGETPVYTTWSETPQQVGGATPIRPGWQDSAFAEAASDEYEGLDARQQRLVKEMRYRNRYLTDEELEELLPPGYEIVPVPADLQDEYARRRRDAEQQREDDVGRHEVPESVGDNLPALRPEDAATFELLLQYRHISDDASLPANVAKSVMILRCILRVKNGDSKQRKQGYRIISEKAAYFGADLLFKHVFEVWMSDTLDDAEKHSIVKLIDRALFRLGTLATPHVARILTLVQPMLTDPDPFNRDEAREVIANLARAVGLKPIVVALRRDIDDPNDDIRLLTARTMAVVAKTLGVAPLAEFLSAVCNSRKSATARHTGLKIIAEIAVMFGVGVRRYLDVLVPAVAPSLSDAQVRIKLQAAHSIAALAGAAKGGIEEFASVIDPIRLECQSNRGKVLGAFLRAMSEMIALMSPSDAIEHARAIENPLIRGFSTVDEDLRRVVLRVVQQLAKNSGIPREYLSTSVAAPFFTAFWSVRMAIDRRTSKLLVDATVELSKRVGAAVTLQQLSERLRDREQDHFQRTTLDAIQRIVAKVGTNDCGSELINQLVETVLEALNMDSTGTAHLALHCIVQLSTSLGPRMSTFVPQLLGLSSARLTHGAEGVRRQAAELIGRTAGVVVQCREHVQTLLGSSRALVERLNSESDADALAAALRAVRQIFDALPTKHVMQPPPADILQQVMPIVKNPAEDVQEGAIQLIGTIARAANDEPQVSNPTLRMKFFQLAKDSLFYLLKAKRKRTRVVTAETFGEIATAITPAPIVKQLLNNLKKDDRTERICTEVALSVVAKRCGPYVVVPFLINEFRLSQGTELAEKMQHAVLKTLRFLFEYLGTDAADYIYSVVPLLEWSLTEKSMQHRRMACEVVRHMALCAVGRDLEDVFLHLLNLIHPNLIESSVGSEQVRLTTAVAETFEAANLVVHPAYLVRMLEQGMFHPARKVRDTYWRIYNTVYLASGAECMLPNYAPVGDEGANTYRHHLLEVMP